MITNVGTIDRVIRGVAGLALITWALAGGPVWAWVGVVFTLTAATAWCPAYIPFGISTCARKK
jgi:hypothetical protein